MKKFFNLLVLVAMCLAISTNVSAQTKRTQTRKTATTTKRSTTTTKKATTVKKATTSAVKPKPQMVDMGLSVKWSNIDLGAATTKSGGALYASTTDVAAQCGEGWRLPTLSEFNELLASCDKSIKETNGVPTCVEFTSKNNGAKLYFYFPKTALKNPNNAKTLSNPYNGSYMIYFHLSDGSSEAFVCTKMENASPQARQLKPLLAKAGLSKVKYSEWPNEFRAQLKPIEDQGGFVSDYMDWLGVVQNVNDVSGMKMSIRPVYSVDEDDE